MINKLLKDALYEIEKLRQKNQLLEAKTETFDNVMLLVNRHYIPEPPPNINGMMSREPEITQELRTAIDEYDTHEKERQETNKQIMRKQYVQRLTSHLRTKLMEKHGYDENNKEEYQKALNWANETLKEWDFEDLMDGNIPGYENPTVGDILSQIKGIMSVVIGPVSEKHFVTEDELNTYLNKYNSHNEFWSPAEYIKRFKAGLSHEGFRRYMLVDWP
jgi:hypothetical protein